MAELLLRFAIGGGVVSLFAVLSDAFDPKSFGGIFSAAPSVALATLGIAFARHGGAYAAELGRSMIAGAVGLFAYSLASAWAVKRKRRLHTSAEVVLLWAVWLAVAFGAWVLAVR
jgi:hypothetical protein